MAILQINWNAENTDGNPSVTGLRISKRVKAVGGAWDTSGFDTPNDMANSLATNQAVVTANRVYEFKVESLCSAGGPVQNLNGVQEGIAFECITPGKEFTHNSLQVTIPTLLTDITKARIVVHLTSDDSIVSSGIYNSNGVQIQANITSLVQNTEYYFTVELYAMVNGFEVISSDAAFLNAVCGGTVDYEFQTPLTPDANTLSGGLGNSISAACADIRELYINEADADIETGVIVYADVSLSTPATGYSVVRAQNGRLYNINNTTGVVGSEITASCGGVFEVVNEAGVGNTINSISPIAYHIIPGALPVAGGETKTGKHGSYSGDFTVNITVITSLNLTLYVDGAPVDTVSVPSSGDYVVSGTIIPSLNVTFRLHA